MRKGSDQADRATAAFEAMRTAALEANIIKNELGS